MISSPLYVSAHWLKPELQKWLVTYKKLEYVFIVFPMSSEEDLAAWRLTQKTFRLVLTSLHTQKMAATAKQY